MKRIFIVALASLMLGKAWGQTVSLKELLFAVQVSTKKFDNYLNKKRFTPVNKWLERDTMISTYFQKKKNKRDTLTTITRIIETYKQGRNFSFAFQTSSGEELEAGMRELKGEGFFCGNSDTSLGAGLLYQRRSIRVQVGMIINADNDTLYSFLFHREMLPVTTGIQYAEDLLQFSSHEYLCAAFGEKNVLKDQYFFSDKEISHCSVLFPRTNRQAVFIWADEENFCRLSYVLIGGNLPIASLKNSTDKIEENTWMSKEGIYSGMSLDNLIRLNGNDFNFYGKKSLFPFMIVPEKTGSIDFRKNQVVLGCLNPNGAKVLNNAMISTGDLAYNNPGIYVFMFMIMPPEREAYGREAKNYKQLK